MSKNLTPENGYIFRITHRANIEWILDNGLHCANSGVLDPNFVAIGNDELIEKRKNRSINVGPEGTISDYVSFYFTPYSPMLRNIKTGYNGVTKHANSEILIIGTSLGQLEANGVPYVYSDRHAKLEAAEFFTNREDLVVIDWKNLQARNFARDVNDPEKFERYQAEVLAHNHVPIAALSAIICYNQTVCDELKPKFNARGITLPLHVKSSWYFS